ncbi:MAG TPA: glycosyl hydrolase-related protein, partial [Candidatus Binatus sp.]|nr:glycosyl hydrolase-related protein [Candidatus Binatus sp.]
IRVAAAPDGTLTVRFGDRSYPGLAAIEDAGDRGDTYDFDPVAIGAVAPEEVRVRRRVDPTGIRHLLIRRTLSLPAALAPDRGRRSDERVTLIVDTSARLVPGTSRVDLGVRLSNTARDHRLRLVFPTGRAAAAFHAATTFDVTRRQTGVRDASRWVHPAPATFPQHGFICVNGLGVAAPGLPEAEVTPDGAIAVTLVRAVGWLARMDLTTRPQPAGPVMATPGAQCLETIAADLALFAGIERRAALDAELGLRAVAAGEAPLVPPDRPLLHVAPREILLSALKPAEDGAGTVLRLLNPTDGPLTAHVAIGFPLSRVVRVRLDETPEDGPVALDGATVSVVVPAHGLRSLLLIR